MEGHGGQMNGDESKHHGLRHFLLRQARWNFEDNGKQAFMDKIQT